MTPDLVSPRRSPVSLNLNTVQPNGQRVKELRQDHGWTQEDLGEKAGYSKRTIENIEASRPVRPGTLAEVAEALGVKLEQVTLLSDGSCILTCHSGSPELPPPVQTRLRQTEELSLNEPGPAEEVRKCSLLVVDDEPTVLRVLTHLLSREFELLIAENAETAAALFATLRDGGGALDATRCAKNFSIATASCVSIAAGAFAEGFTSWASSLA